MSPAQRTINFKFYKSATNTTIWQVKGASARSPFFYDAGMIIDFDGAPDAYAPIHSGLTGRDNLGNAVAINDKQGRSPWLHPPHKKTDPATNPLWTPTYSSTVRDPKTRASITQPSGYYISESSLKDAFHGQLRGAQTDTAYQTDANTYPYIALSSKHFHDSGLQVGDYALAIHGQTGKSCFAVYGDAKNTVNMGESSAALAKKLGVPAGNNQGTASGIIYVVFPDSGLGNKLRCDLQSLPVNGMRWLKLYNDRLDLVAQITKCYSPEFPGVALAFKTLGL